MHSSLISRNKKIESKLLEPPHSISDQIYEYLRQKILYGDIEPGQRLMQIQVAEDLKTSRTPVRDAFRRLEQDGLVERIPQGGVRVTLIDNETVKKVFGIRKVLEAYAIDLACDRITTEEIASLKRLVSQAREVLSSHELGMEMKIKRLFRLNSQFHETLYRASGNSYLMGMINSLRSIVSRLRLLGLRADSTWSRAWDEHAQLIELLEGKNKDSAIRLTQSHLVNAASDVLSGLSTIGSNGVNSVPDSNLSFEGQSGVDHPVSG